MKHLFCCAALLLSMNLFAGTPARTILLYPNGAGYDIMEPIILKTLKLK